MVRSKGIRVMLTGLGGDDLLSSGYGHLADLFMRGRWIRLRRQVEADARAMSSTARATFIRYALLPLIGGFPRAFLKEMRDRMHGPQFPRWIDAEFLSRLGVLESMKRADRVSRPGSHAQQDIYRAVLSGSLRNLSLIYLDQTCYSFQVEHRHPFLDRRIIEYLWAIPPEQRRRYDVTKVVLRAAMKGILPESIRLRSGKTSFQPVYERQIRNHRPPQEMLEDSYLVSVGAVRPEGMKHLLASFQKAGIESDRMWEIYRFVWMESWSRQIAREAVVPETVRC
jgi:asparagine synthase (glutamine-hydrolysing)